MGELSKETLSRLKNWLERTVTVKWTYFMDSVVLDNSKNEYVGKFEDPANVTGVVDLVNIAPDLIETALRYSALLYDHSQLKDEVEVLHRAVDGKRRSDSRIKDYQAQLDRAASRDAEANRLINNIEEWHHRRLAWLKDPNTVSWLKETGVAPEVSATEVALNNALAENKRLQDLLDEELGNGRLLREMTKTRDNAVRDRANMEGACAHMAGLREIDREEILRLRGMIAEECTAHKATRDRAEGLKQRIVELGKAAEKV